MASLEVFVANATNVPNVEKIGKSDPYVIVEYQGNQKKSEVVKGELNPVFNEKIVYDLGTSSINSGDELKLYIKDWEMVGRNRLLGQATVPLKDFKGSKSQKLSLAMKDGSGRATDCTLSIQITYKAPGGGKQEAMTASHVGTESAAAPGDEEEEEEEDDEEEDEGDSPDGAPRKKKKKKKKRAGSRKVRPKLSNKPQDFQVRVKVVEARQLPGANISPVARITCYNQTKQTRIKKSTNSPFFNEVFFFNYFCSPAELFDELIQFAVFNSRNLRKDALIGSFKCDVGMIYDEEGHSLLNKWLLLSDPEDQMAGAKGYLKISATVLGPGDDAPSFKPADQDDDEDIESNLLRPAGVQLRPATFKLKLYRAEDIPRMDPNMFAGVKKVFGSSDTKKELVDPYTVFSFAGTEVKSKIMYNSDHPEFNQELRLGLRFPSMCERIKLQMFDWDRLSEDDAIGTAFIAISNISAPGDFGFLPTFGPCYINFYGSPREYSDLPDEYEDLNLGKGEGVAYRGRVLVELQTHLGEFPETESDDLPCDDVYKIQKFQRRRKFKLHCAFMNATMVSSIDSPIEFEVSIGNYGNKLDENIVPCASTTQPTNAVFDGCYYHFLPWGDNKPCVVVDSQWEDMLFRLESLNMLKNMINRLETNIEKVRIGLQANLPTPELAQLMISLLDQLVLDCKKDLPVPIEGQQIQNDLDRQLRFYRESELYHIRKDAAKLRESATDINEALASAETYLAQLGNLAIEPQNSIPDVMIWMITGEKRIAFFRCPVYDLIWAANPECRGKLCGTLETIMLKGLYPGNKAEKDNKWEIPALLRMKIWFGLEKHEHEWHKMQTEGELAVFAETYENQVSILGKWGTRGPTMTRPKWSDPTGKLELGQEMFEPPPKWLWKGQWYVSPEESMLYDVDAGHSTFLEDMYECQGRIPAGNWDCATVPWADVKGDPVVGRDEIELPPGWEWEEDWEADLNRAVDEEGWEYTVESTLGGYGPVEKRYHMCRRRRWVRQRKLVKSVKQKEEETKEEKAAAEGWEYAPLFTMKFHHKERKMDLVRRRRWHRKMIAEDPRAPCFFKIKCQQDSDSSSSEDEGDEKSMLTAPRMFLHCTKKSKYHLRAYIYQARDILAGDSNGLSDPFTRVCFLNQSQVTEKLEKTLCPTWDQTLIFEAVDIHGDPELIAIKPPEIVLELFDHDTFGEPEFLGRTTAYPMVKLDPSDMRSPVLQWYPIKKGSLDGGEMLAAFELFRVNPERLQAGKGVSSLMNGRDLPFMPPKRGSLYIVPNGIRPVMQRTAVEIMCWGVRNMRKFQLSSVNSPSIEFEIGGHQMQSKVIKNTKVNPNFDENLLFCDVMLPKEELYMPPMNIRVRDNRQFGRKPMVGISVLKSLEDYRFEPLPAIEDAGDGLDIPSVMGDGTDPLAETVVDMPGEKGEKDPMGKKSRFGLPKLKLGKVGALKIGGDKEDEHNDLWDEDIDWWSKYYASTGELDKCRMFLENGYDRLELFNNELEKVMEYKDFQDFCHTFELNRGKSLEEEESNVVGQFKGTFRVYPLPGDPNEELPRKYLDNLPPSSPEDCVIRIYIVKAIDLQPNDPSGLADPYIECLLGKRKMNNRDFYVPNNLSPVFGKMFEVKARLPVEKDLYIRIKDYDLIGSDDIIGETVIDLENRFLTKYRATVGLPKSFCTSGPCDWRDSMKPKEILELFCTKHLIPAPIFTGNNVVKVGSRVFNLADFEQNKPKHPHLGDPDQRLSLHVLNVLPPSMNLPLVPEHVEQRPLYNPLQPGIEQGKLQMWVDIFPLSLGELPSPVNITPRKPKKYDLRIVIWNTSDVILEEESITGEKMSDIYVKGWIAGIDERQETDIHYRSLDGEGNFNWRFVFPFEYLPAEGSLVVRKKEHFWSLDETELHLPCILMIQIWDNDKFSADDFLGTLELNLNSMPKPVKKAGQCNLDQLPDVTKGHHVKMVSLFEQKRIKGFWPCYNDESGTKELTGKVEMELELMAEDEASEKPSGKGREEPNQYPMLDPPKRPETSFLWFTSPWKTFKYIVWKNYKWYFIGGFLILLLIVFIVLFIYSVPGAMVTAIVT